MGKIDAQLRILPSAIFGNLYVSEKNAFVDNNVCHFGSAALKIKKTLIRYGISGPENPTSLLFTEIGAFF